MIHVAVAEDNEQNTELLRRYLTRFSEEHHIEIHTDFFSDGKTLLEHYHPRCNILLLDIAMPNLDGIRAARLIRQIDPNVILIFITNLAHMVMKGYEVQALDFILKPVSYPQFELKFRHAVEMAEIRKQEYLILNTPDGTVRLPIPDILYIEVSRHKLHYHTAEKIYSLPGSLKDIEEKYQKYYFVRCNQGCLINLRNVSYATVDTVYAGKTALSVSRSRRKAFMEALTDYYGGNRLCFR